MVDELNEEKDHSVPDGKSLKKTTKSPANIPAREIIMNDL